MEKGSYGYMDDYKRRKLMVSAILLSLIAVAIIVVLVVFQTKNTFFIVIPIILVLPFAKYFVAFIVVQPYVTMARESYERVCQVVSGNEHIVPVYDVTLVSEAGISYLDFIIVLDGVVYGCASHSNKKFKALDMQAYLQKLIQGAGYQNKAFVYEGIEETLQAVNKRLKAIPQSHSYNDKSSKSIKKAILVVGV